MNKKKDSKEDIKLLKGEPLQSLIKFTQQFCVKFFNESATVISHLLCNNVSQKETFNTIIKWMGETEIENSSRLGMESLTSALITSVGISNQLLLNTFSKIGGP